MQTFGNEGDSAVPSEVFYFWFPPKIFSIFIFWYKQKVQEHAFRTQVRPNCSTHVGPCVLNGSGCNCVRSRVLKLCFQHCSIWYRRNFEGCLFVSQENAGFSRVLSSDYIDPGANTNESGYYISPSDQTPDVPQSPRY